MDKISTKIGKNLKKIRISNDMSQSDLAKKLGVDRAYISGVENGKRNPTIETLSKIANALEVGINKLVD